MPERNQIILGTFAKALSLIDEAGKANDSGAKSSCQILLWKSAAEAEYLAFQMSMVHGLGDYEPSADDLDASLNGARTLIRDAQSTVQSDPRTAYSAVRRAVAILRKMYSAGEEVPKRCKTYSKQ